MNKPLEERTRGITIKEGNFNGQYSIHEGIGLASQILGEGSDVLYFTGDARGDHLDVIPLMGKTDGDWLRVWKYKNLLNSLRDTRATINNGVKDIVGSGNYMEFSINSLGRSLNKLSKGSPFINISTTLSHQSWNLELSLEGLRNNEFFRDGKYSSRTSFALRKEFKEVIALSDIVWY